MSPDLNGQTRIRMDRREDNWCTYARAMYLAMLSKAVPTTAVPDIISLPYLVLF